MPDSRGGAGSIDGQGGRWHHAATLEKRRVPGRAARANQGGVLMRSLKVFLLLLACLVTGRASAQAVWLQPSPMLMLGPSLKESLEHFTLRSVSVGANIPVMGKALVVEALFVPGEKSSQCGVTKF